MRRLTTSSSKILNTRYSRLLSTVHGKNKVLNRVPEPLWAIEELNLLTNDKETIVTTAEVSFIY